MPIAQMRGLAARAAQNFEYYAGVVTELHGRSFQVGDEFLNYTIRKPVGVAGLIMPWNAPLMLSTWRHRARAGRGQHGRAQAGRVVAALSRRCWPRSSRRPSCRAGVFNVVHGFGETAGAPLSAHPDVQLICFTGETTTGQTIIAAGAPTLKRSSVELGGKSPVVVFEDADPDLARGRRPARRSSPSTASAAPPARGCSSSARCTSGSSTAVAERARNIRVGDPFDPNTELGPAHPSRAPRARAWTTSSPPARDGAPILAGGERPEGMPDGNFLHATVIADVDESFEVFKEEIFGPVLVAMPFDTEEEAIRLANATEYGLAAYVWTNDIKRAHRVAHAIDTGMCWINSQNVRDLRTPFGGVKNSGIGREGGDYAFEFYCETEIVHVALGTHAIPKIGMPDAGEER